MAERTEMAAANLLEAARILQFKLHTVEDAGLVISTKKPNSRFVDGVLFACPSGLLSTIRYTQLEDGSLARPRAVKSREAYYWSKALEDNPDDPTIRRWFLESLENMVTMHLAMQEKGES